MPYIFGRSIFGFPTPPGAHIQSSTFLSPIFLGKSCAPRVQENIGDQSHRRQNRMIGSTRE
jgi:hypothetical protein